MTASERIRQAREQAQVRANLTGRVWFVYENGIEVWMASADTNSLYRDREPAFTLEPHRYHPSV